jgi:Cyclic nucleotide-binding domain/Major Facilitator Superfamily
MTWTEYVAPVRRVLGVRPLRRVEVGYFGFSFAEHATWLATLVYAGQQGGPSEVGAVAVVMLLPAFVLAPFAAYAGDRFAPQRALAAGYVAQALSMGATAAAMAADKPLLAYAFATVAATCVSFTRPVMGSLLPVLTHAPAELVAANVVANMIEQAGLFVGPATAGVLMAVGSPSWVFVASAVAVGVAALGVLRLGRPELLERRADVEAKSVVRDVFAGFATMRTSPLLRTLVLIAVMAAVAKGIADVIFVTFADARLGDGEGGDGLPGALAAGYGIGALLGAAGSARPLASGRSTAVFVAGAAMVGGALTALSLIGTLPLSLVGFAVMGAGESVLGLAVFVAVQRTAPIGLLSRVFGIVEGFGMGATALGALAVTALGRATSLATALWLLGVALALLVVGCVVALHRRGGVVPPVDERVIERLLHDPLLAPLAAPVVERLARGVESVVFESGDIAVQEGDAGTRYFLVTDGQGEVSIGGRLVGVVSAGDSFGEIALLRDVPRVATVRATTALATLAIERADFLEAVTGNQRSHRLARAKIDSHLDT